MNQFLIGLVERATLHAAVLERRPRSLFEPTAPAPAGPVAIDGDDQVVSGDLDEHAASPQGDGAARRSLREQTRDAYERLQRSEPSPAGSLPRWPGSSASDPSHTRRAADDEPRPVSALDRGLPDPGAKTDSAPASVSIALASPPEAPDQRSAPARAGWRSDDEPAPVSDEQISHRDLAPATWLAPATAPAAPAFASAPPTRQPGPDAALERMLGPAPLPAYSPAPHGDAAPRARRASRAYDARAADPATSAPAPTASDRALASSAPLLRSGLRVPGPPALLVQSQRPAGVPRIGASAAAASPPVHVTIGRLEVRANAPAAERPPARRSPAGPKLSLDDYLNGRRGGPR